MRETKRPSDNERIQQINAKKYKSRYDWVGKAIHWELCKEMKFDHTNKWYIHNPESILANETHKFLWGFEKQIDHLIWAKRPDLVIVINK